MTPAYLVEEHHELFVVWEWAVREGLLPERACRLLHVDEHSDLDIPTPNEPMDFENTAELVNRFFRNELSVASFIWPLVYRSRLNQVSWLHPRRRDVGHRDHFPGRRQFIVTTGRARTEILTGLHRGRDSLNERFSHDLWNDDYRTVWIEQLGLEDSLQAGGNWVLGICLDFFSCNSRPVAQSWELPISDEVAAEFRANPIHFLRLFPGPGVVLDDSSSQAKLLFGNSSEPEWDWRVVSNEVVEERLAGLEQFLLKCQLRPQLIVVSRSEISGYTPANQVAFIEQGVRAILERVFGLPLEPFQHCRMQEGAH